MVEGEKNSVSTRLTYEETSAAIMSIMAAGEKVTYDAILMRTGHGSRSTIKKHKTRFYSELTEKKRAAFCADIPEPLVEMLHSIWAQALSHAMEVVSRDPERIRSAAMSEGSIVDRDIQGRS